MNIIELQSSLRQLRLGGMADVLETRLRQAQVETMASWCHSHDDHRCGNAGNGWT